VNSSRSHEERSRYGLSNPEEDTRRRSTYFIEKVLWKAKREDTQRPESRRYLAHPFRETHGGRIETPLV
jgi:hypothetical protein